MTDANVDDGFIHRRLIRFRSLYTTSLTTTAPPSLTPLERTGTASLPACVHYSVYSFRVYQRIQGQNHYGFSFSVSTTSGPNPCQNFPGLSSVSFIIALRTICHRRDNTNHCNPVAVAYSCAMTGSLGF